MTLNSEIKIAICDDLIEERTKIRNLLEQYLDENYYVASIDEYESGEQLLKSDISKYNLIVLDIFMEELNGIETTKKIMKVNNNVSVIFCSTSNEFAQESYDVDALRYLTKPVSKEKLFLTLDKYFRIHTSLKMLKYKQNRMEETVYLSDVLWIEAGDHKSIIHTKQGEIVSSTLFKQFCEDLQNMGFIKPIRFALVSMDAIVNIPNEEIKLSDGTIIGISRDMKKEVKKIYADYKLKQLLRKGGIA
jgi:DNA-binding LytR/AlgR family response regulator